MKIYTNSNWAYGYRNKHSDRRIDIKMLRVELEPNSSPIMSPKRNPTGPIVNTLPKQLNMVQYAMPFEHGVLMP